MDFDLSVFLAKVLGATYIAAGLGILFNGKHFKKILNGFVDSPTAMYIGGLMAMLIGGTIVFSHNVWDGTWEVVITVLGWLGLAKGVALLVLPEKMRSLTKSAVEASWMHIATVVALALGAYLLYYGLYWS